MRNLNLIVIHCSASPNGVFITPEQIDAWHAAPPHSFHRDERWVKQFRPNLPHIGYHRLVLANGEIGYGRDIEEVGAHVANHNVNSIGICMIGTSAFYLAQWKSLREILGVLALRLRERAQLPAEPSWYPVPSPADTMVIFNSLGIRVVGHRDLSPDLNGDGVIQKNEWLKTCPGFDVRTWLDAGMSPPDGGVLDDHPALTSNRAPERALMGMRWNQ